LLWRHWHFVISTPLINECRTCQCPDLSKKKKVSCRRREFHGGRHETSLVFSSYRDADSLRHGLGVSDDVSVPKFAWAPSLATADSDENGRKQTEKPHFYFHFYIFWRKRDRVQKIRVRKWDRVTQKYGNEPIQTLSRKE
jgi:hypothetical protein